MEWTGHFKTSSSFETPSVPGSQQLYRDTRVFCNWTATDSSKIEEIVDFMSREDMSIAAVQDTKLNSTQIFSGVKALTSFVKIASEIMVVAKPSFYITHSNIVFRLIDGDIDSKRTTLECQGIVIRSGDVKLEIFNIIYTSPQLHVAQQNTCALRKDK